MPPATDFDPPQPCQIPASLPARITHSRPFISTAFRSIRVSPDEAGEHTLRIVNVQGAPVYYGRISGQGKAAAFRFFDPADRETVPRLLSLTGIYSDIAARLPDTSLKYFELNSALWSDGAAKQRWIILPPPVEACLGFSARPAETALSFGPLPGPNPRLVPTRGVLRKPSDGGSVQV
jgi:hypothetical protein